jgi:hypothetical protein
VKNTPSEGKDMASVFRDSRALLIEFLLEQRNINAAYYSELLKAQVKRASLSKRQGISVKILSPRQRASAHRRCDNRNIGENALGGTATPRP